MSKMSLRFFLWLIAGLISIPLNAQRYYAPLPLGQSVYDVQTKNPVSVQYLLPVWTLGAGKRESAWGFLPDIPDSVCLIRSSYYRKTGYDRGHMMAAADRSFDKGVMRSTFVMSNVSPQTPTLNRGEWSRAESEVRMLARYHGAIKVFNAPIFFQEDTAWIQPYGIAIPHAFLKVAMSVNCDSVYKVFFLLNR